HLEVEPCYCRVPERQSARPASRTHLSAPGSGGHRFGAHPLFIRHSGVHTMRGSIARCRFGSGMRTRCRCFITAALVFFLTQCTAPAQDPIDARAEAARAHALALDQKVIAIAKEESEIMANLTYLSDIIGPRLTGSAALKRANQWAADKLKS